MSIDLQTLIDQATAAYNQANQEMGAIKARPNPVLDEAKRKLSALQKEYSGLDGKLRQAALDFDRTALTELQSRKSFLPVELAAARVAVKQLELTVLEEAVKPAYVAASAGRDIQSQLQAIKADFDRLYQEVEVAHYRAQNVSYGPSGELSRARNELSDLEAAEQQAREKLADELLNGKQPPAPAPKPGPEGPRLIQVYQTAPRQEPAPRLPDVPVTKWVSNPDQPDRVVHLGPI